jgi:hypothetical protein
MTDGQRIDGTLDLIVSTEAGGRRYDLRTASEVRLTSLAKNEVDMEPTLWASTDPWELFVQEPARMKIRVHSPHFRFEYPADFLGIGRRYIPRAASAVSFYVVVGDEEHLVNLADCEEIGLAPEDQITVNRAATGTLILRKKVKGDYRKGSDWKLFAHLAHDGTKILLTNATATLRRL